MRKVYIRVLNFGSDVEISTTSNFFPIDECQSIFQQFLSENKIKGRFSKATHTYDNNIIIHCSLSVEDLRDFKLKQIII
jgi:hypothetical protein